MTTHIHYVLHAMSQGELMRGMYTTSDAAESPEIARQLKRPKTQYQDATALCRVESADSDIRGEYSRRLISLTILEILPQE